MGRFGDTSKQPSGIRANSAASAPSCCSRGLASRSWDRRYPSVVSPDEQSLPDPQLTEPGVGERPRVLIAGVCRQAPLPVLQLGLRISLVVFGEDTVPRPERESQDPCTGQEELD